MTDKVELVENELWPKSAHPMDLSRNERKRVT